MSTKQVINIIAKLGKETELEAKKLVLDIHEGLATDTPVDTGWAANNWLTSITTPVEKTSGTPERISTSESQAGIASILRWRFIQGPAFITNNVPYISELNDGSSKKAPKGFVEADINSAVAKSNKARLK
jgi:hypothetical protein